MTKQLDDFFNISPVSEKEQELIKDIVVSSTSLQGIDSNTAIVDLTDITDHSNDMDVIAEKAMEGYEVAMDYANNVDERNVAGILATAAQLQKNAIDAKESKAKFRMQAANLLFRKKVYDDKEALKDADVIENEVEEDTIEGDRNKILDAIRSQQRKDIDSSEER